MRIFHNVWCCLMVAVVLCVFAFPHLPLDLIVCSPAGAHYTLPSLPSCISSSPLLCQQVSLSFSFLLLFSLLTSLLARRNVPTALTIPHHPVPPPPFSLSPSFSVYHYFLLSPSLLFFFCLFLASTSLLCPLLLLFFASSP